jgi:hypothetical protein
MAEVDIKMSVPVPVKPKVETVTLKMSLTEAAYVCAILGNGNSYEAYRRAGVTEKATGAYFQLHDALVQAGAVLLVAQLARGAEEWENYRRGK